MSGVFDALDLMLMDKSRKGNDMVSLNDNSVANTTFYFAENASVFVSLEDRSAPSSVHGGCSDSSAKLRSSAFPHGVICPTGIRPIYRMLHGPPFSQCVLVSLPRLRSSLTCFIGPNQPISFGPLASRNAVFIKKVKHIMKRAIPKVVSSLLKRVSRFVEGDNLLGNVVYPGGLPAHFLHPVQPVFKRLKHFPNYTSLGSL